MKESLNFCIPGTHFIEMHYNSSLIYVGNFRNLTPPTVINKALLYV
jgi:hypothetical protein